MDTPGASDSHQSPKQKFDDLVGQIHKQNSQPDSSSDEEEKVGPITPQ